MNIYPAIDLRGGQVVRLNEGDPNRQTVFSDDPLQTARDWIEQGATWIHMVNLDGAFDEANDNLAILRDVCQLNGVQVQFGGGLRSLQHIEAAIHAGAQRVVLGTIALKEPEIVAQAVREWGAERVCVALDAKDGKVTTHGWTETSDLTPIQLGRMMAERGVRYALYTDVRRDGSLIGVNVTDTIRLARNTTLNVIASGGVSHMSEIQQLARSGVVEGAIIGMALYTGRLSLQEALLASQTPANNG